MPVRFGDLYELIGENAVVFFFPDQAFGLQHTAIGCKYHYAVPHFHGLGFQVALSVFRSPGAFYLQAVVVKFYMKSFRHEVRSEEPTSKLQSLMRISSAVLCLNKKKTHS